MIIKEIKNHCPARHPRVKAYRNEVWDLVENLFEAFNIQFVPRDGNRLADSLAVASNTFRPHINPKLRYEVEMKYRLSIPNNIKNWQVFEDDQQIKEFLTMIDDFEGVRA